MTQRFHGEKTDHSFVNDQLFKKEREGKEDRLKKSFKIRRLVRAQDANLGEGLLWCPARNKK